MSKVATRYLKRHSLAVVVALRAKDKAAGMKTNETSHVDVAHPLQSLNSNARRSPRKLTEMQPPPVQVQSSNLNPGPNSTESPNITSINTDPLNAMDALNNPDYNDGIQHETSRKKRGKTMMKTFSCMPNEKAEIEFNDRGQPIGSNSKHLSSYLGTLAREMVTLTISEWKKVDTNLKKDLGTCIQV